MEINLFDYFGVNIAKMWRDWFADEFTTWYMKTYGNRGKTATIMLIPWFRVDAAMADPENADSYAAFIMYIGGDEAAARKPDGTYFNIMGKALFSLVTGEDSVEAERRPHLTFPGVFPWEGCVFVDGTLVSVSALEKDEDALAGRRCGHKLNELMAEVAMLAKKISDDWDKNPEKYGGPRPAEVKYLNSPALNARIQKCFPAKYWADAA